MPDGATELYSTAMDTVNGPSTEIVTAATVRRVGDVE